MDQNWEAQPNLTMLGDAAHVMPPFPAKGANMAMRDALKLSQCLCDDNFGDVRTAIAFYENQMRERAAKAAQESSGNGERMHNANALETMLAFFGSR